MALKTTVKISSVNNLSDARYCAGMGVDFMGFQLSKNAETYVDYQNFVELTGWVSGVEFVGEFTDSSEQEIIETAKQYELDYIQIQDASLIPALKPLDKKLMLKYNMEELADASAVAKEMEAYKDDIAYFLFESDQGITYKTHIQEEVLKLADQYPVLFGFNLSEDNVEELIASSIKGISLKGGEEIRPGYKDFDEMADILEALELDD